MEQWILKTNRKDCKEYLKNNIPYKYTYYGEEEKGN